MVLVDELNFDNEGEFAALLPLRLTDDVAAELPDQLAADVQPQSDSTRVYFLRFLEEPVHFEQFRHVFLSDADPSVRYTDLQKVARILELAQRIR